ncbi:MAG: hypothetical protein CL450_07040 [Acidimicrobiaceae bacterium]|nr:hypothetical protein [Acidimicrobiaceae bacterium]
MSYRDSLYIYRQAPSSGNQITVIAFPATIGVTTQFSAVAGLPATVTPSTIAATAGVATSIDIDANYVEAHEGIELTASLPAISLLIGQQINPAAIAVTTTMAPTIEVILNVGTIAATSTVANSHDVDANYTFNAATIAVKATTPNVPLHRIIDPMPVENVRPMIGPRNEPTPAAFALFRHYQPESRGINLIIVNNTSVQTFMPADQSTATRVIYGGHVCPDDLTATEQDILIAAGYKLRVGAAV